MMIQIDDVYVYVVVGIVGGVNIGTTTTLVGIVEAYRDLRWYRRLWHLSRRTKVSAQGVM